MARSLSDIKDDFSERLQSSEIIPEFIDRNDDFVEMANIIGEAFAPYELQIEAFLDIYTDATLLALFLEKRGMYLKGDENLAALQSIANKMFAIRLFRGTGKQKPELARLFAVTEAEMSHDIYNMYHLSWITRRTSPNWRSSADSINMCYLRLEELYAIYSYNSSKRYDEDVLKILVNKFFPQNMNSIWVPTTSTLKFNHIDDMSSSSNTVYNGTDFVKVRIGLKNLDPIDTAEQAFIIGKYEFSTLKGWSLSVDEDFIYLMVADNSYPVSREYLKSYRVNYIDVIINKDGITNYDGSDNPIYVHAFLNGKEFAKELYSNAFDLDISAVPFRLGKIDAGVKSATFDLVSLTYENENINGKLIYNFNADKLPDFLYVKNKGYAENEVFKLTNTSGS